MLSFIMANIQRLAVSVLLILTVSFLYFAQTGEAAQGKCITATIARQWIHTTDTMIK